MRAQIALRLDTGKAFEGREYKVEFPEWYGCAGLTPRRFRAESNGLILKTFRWLGFMVQVHDWRRFKPPESGETETPTPNSTPVSSSLTVPRTD